MIINCFLYRELPPGILVVSLYIPLYFLNYDTYSCLRVNIVSFFLKAVIDTLIVCLVKTVKYIVLQQFFLESCWRSRTPLEWQHCGELPVAEPKNNCHLFHTNQA